MAFNRLPTLRADWKRPNLIFWVGFFALNALFFLPIYLLNRETTPLFPPISIFADGLWIGLTRLFLWRENLDPFRLCLEMTLLIALWVNVRMLQRPLFRVIIATVYVLAFCYYLYEAIIVSIYHADPVFFSQYYLARDGIPFLAQHAHASLWLYGLAIVGVLAALITILIIINALLDSGAALKLPRSTRIITALLATLSLFAGFRYQIYTAKPEMILSSLTFKLEKNIADSFDLYNDIASFDDTAIRQAYDYTAYTLDKKPNIYLIFVESYGSVLYKRADYRAAYTKLLGELEQQLNGDGWQATSALSESPTWGGGSWMAYTSTLFGLRIDNHPQYLSLLNKYQVQSYPDLGRYLKTQGYYYAWVSSIADELDDRMWNRYIRFLGVDQWLRYRDLNYNGPLYGWGPAPPDQYVLNYANQVLQKRTDQPLLFVTITQNSHFPWVPQPPVVEDWRTFDEMTVAPAEADAAPIESTGKRQNYLTAVEVQLRMLTDLILNSGDEESLFILVGDHQPPQVSGRFDGWATPVHIISKDQALIDIFAQYGFTPGLKVKTTAPTLHHEGNYSLFVRALLERYGVDPLALPAYLPNGVRAESQLKTALP